MPGFLIKSPTTAMPEVEEISEWTRFSVQGVQSLAVQTQMPEKVRMVPG